ncbi:glycosyltransferase family A protein [Hyalangium sp.]|uniref:glycosyltransferase family A protein n=1 Tax=Hyalangium sp. TaxID=2028555 RepID=UPI002D24AF94|nr:glycosyltransferase family A protein [Hyalangium sp.]HYH95517.1 glycosyltransferase family A protein [Hyalangium sp.]
MVSPLDLAKSGAESEGTRLRSFVLGRVVPGSRVGVVGKDQGLTQALSAAGCSVWEGGASELEVLRRFAPTHVVLMERVQGEGLEARLRSVHAVAPEAELLLGFDNAGAAGALLATLIEGAPSRQGPSEVGFLRCLSACGLRVVHREAHTDPPPRGSLAVGAERALRQLLAQLAPGTVDDMLLYALVRVTSEPVAANREPGLLSIVLWSGPEHRNLLDEAVFSLACQRYRPFEIVLVEPEPVATGPGDAVRTLETYRRIEGFRFQHVRGRPDGLMDEAIRRARGQYLAFFEASGLVYPGHFEKLIQALREGEAAWAVSRAFRRMARAVPGDEDYVETKIPFPLGDHLELAHLREHPWLLHALVIDRDRLASMPLHVPDPRPGQVAALPLQLAAIFEPVFLNGLATCEQQVSESAPPILEGGVGALHFLRTFEALEQAVMRARASGQSAKDLRHRALDELNSRLRRWAPWVHHALRSTAARWLK